MYLISNLFFTFLKILFITCCLEPSPVPALWSKLLCNGGSNSLWCCCWRCVIVVWVLVQTRSHSSPSQGSALGPAPVAFSLEDPRLSSSRPWARRGPRAPPPPHNETHVFSSSKIY